MVDGSSLYVAGELTLLQGTARSYVGRLTRSTGALDPWAPPSTDARIYALAKHGTDIVAGGIFNTLAGGSNRRVVDKLDTSTGADIPWLFHRNRYSTSDGASSIAVHATSSDVSAIGRDIGSSTHRMFLPTGDALLWHVPVADCPLQGFGCSTRFVGDDLLVLAPGLERGGTTRSGIYRYRRPTPPTVIDNQSNDLTWRQTSATYDIDATDDVELWSFYVQAYSGPGRTGTRCTDWTAATFMSGTSWTTDWQLPWTPLCQGTNYISVMATDRDGMSSVAIDAFTVRKDTVAPTNPSTAGIRDVTTTLGVDEDAAPDNVTLSGSWSLGSDSSSGVASYEWCFSTTDATGSGTCSAIAGTGTSGSGNTTRNVTATASPALVNGSTWYLCVRTTDNVGLVATSWRCSDGATVPGAPPTLSLAVDSPTIALESALPGEDVFGTSTITVETDNANGYTLSASDTSDSYGMSCACGGSIADWTGTSTTPTTWPASYAGFAGLAVRDTTGTTTNRLAKWGTANPSGWPESNVTDTRYAGLSQSGSVLLHATSSGTPVGGDDVLATYRVDVSSTTRAGSYAGTVSYTLTANP
jgi:hypothetical protein